MRRLLVLAVIWGFSFLFIKVAGEGMTPPTVAGVRVALGCATLVAYLRLTGGSLPSDRTSWKHLFLVAIFANVLPFTLLAWGEQRIDSGLTALLNGATPLFTAVATGVLLHERLRAPQVAGLLVGLVGVGITAGVGATEVTGSTLAGGAAAVGAGACYGLALAWSKRHLMHLPAESAAAGQLLAASIWLAPFAIGTSLVDGIQLTPTRLVSIVLLGCVGTGIAYVLYYQLVAEIGPTRTSLVTYLVPIVAVVVGAVALHERLTLRQAMGAVLIVGGILLVNRGGPSTVAPATSDAPLPWWRRRRPRQPGASMAGVAVVLLLPLAACSGSGSEAAGGCRPPVRERLDPTFVVHLVAGAEEPEYLSDPPTSGPHLTTEAPSGAQDEPLDRPLQLTALEVGLALAQYDPDLPADQREALEGLADDTLVVAPNPDLSEPVVLTAWTWKQTCETVDAATVARFAQEHAGDAPGADF
jgi:drug/metabolite transporter (DMT)-like permease